MTTYKQKRRFNRFGALTVSALSLCAVALPLAPAKAQIGFGCGLYGWRRYRAGRHRTRQPVLRRAVLPRLSGLLLRAVFAAVLLAVLTPNLLHPRPERAPRRPLFFDLLDQVGGAEDLAMAPAFLQYERQERVGDAFR